MTRIYFLAAGLAALALSSTSASACGGFMQSPCPRANLTVVPMNQPPKPAAKAVAAPVNLAPAKGTSGSVLANKTPSGSLLGNNNGGSLIATGGGNAVAQGAGNFRAGKN